MHKKCKQIHTKQITHQIVAFIPIENHKWLEWSIKCSYRFLCFIFYQKKKLKDVFFYIYQNWFKIDNEPILHFMVSPDYSIFKNVSDNKAICGCQIDR